MAGVTLVTSLIACATRLISGMQPAGSTSRPCLSCSPATTLNRLALPGPLPVAVGGALDVRGPGRHGRQRVRHRAGGVVMAVDAQPRAGRIGDRGDHVTELGGQHAAVGVAQRHQVGAGLHRRADHLQRVGRVGPVAVEEVLGVEENPPALAAQMADGVGDHGEVLGQGGAQRELDVPVVALGDQRHHRRAGLAQGGDLRIVGGHRVRPAGRAERRQLRVGQPQLGARPPEELGVLRDRARPSALDEPDTELVQPPRDGELVGHGQGQALLLGTVAQGGVVDMERVVGHHLVIPPGRY